MDMKGALMQKNQFFACVGETPNPKKEAALAIYHLSVKTISRSAGRSATAAAAYRSGDKIHDERIDKTHDYTRRHGVSSSELVLPENAPDWASQREALWNAAEQAEKRKNSTVAREFEIALPEELPEKERKALAHDLAREIVARHGCAADVAIHEPNQDGDQRNHHAHIMLSTRRLTSEGFQEKTRELDDRKTGSQIVTEWRERFAELQNARLKANQIEERVDHRSLKDQGKEQFPTLHEGPKVTGMRRRGELTETAQKNEQRKAQNAEIIDLAAARAHQEKAKKSRVDRLSDDEVIAEYVKRSESLLEKKNRQISRIQFRAECRHTQLVRKRRKQRQTEPNAPLIWRTQKAMNRYQKNLDYYEKTRERIVRRDNQVEDLAERLKDPDHVERLAIKNAAKAMIRQHPELTERAVEVMEQQQKENEKIQAEAQARREQERAARLARAAAERRERNLQRSRDRSRGGDELEL